MTTKRRFSFFFSFGLCIAMLGAGLVSADNDTLIRIERSPGADRGALIDAGTTLVAELNDAWLALGDPLTIEDTATRMSLASEVVTVDPSQGSLALVGLRSKDAVDDLSMCGRIIAEGDDWHLVHNETAFSPGCIESTQWFIRTLDLEPLKPHQAPPAEWAGPVEGSATRVPDPLVQEIVDLVDVPLALAHWTALSDSPTWTTRHSSSQGCVDAATYVHGLFEGYGLGAEFQNYSTTYADNVVGTLTGSVNPDQVYILIGHLDDLPSSGPAPGADDNASGTAMVTAAAEVMSSYCFESTVKFIAVTGEEQGLHGSDHYADDAASRGENIMAVLNGDMIGWEGDGQPTLEDLDINYNAGSQWLAQAMATAATDYGTGLTINAIDCPSMTYSDHAPFWSNGFSAVCGITDNEGFCGEGGNYPYYHQSNDTISNCGPGAPAFEAAAIRTYVATVAHLAQPIARVPLDPTGVTALPNGANRIDLSWDSPAPGVEVRIHRAPGSCVAPAGPQTHIGDTTGSSFVDTTASGGIPYAYTITNIAAGSCSSATAVCVEATTTGACTEPPVFTGVDQVANAAASNCLLTVEWSAPDQVWCGGPVTYNVYRSVTPGFTPSVHNRIATGVSSTSMDDFDVVSGEPAHYIVRAVDQSHGNEDANTHEEEGTPTGPAVVGTWSDDAGDTVPAKLIPESPWTITAGAGVTGSGYATGPYSSDTCKALTSPSLILDASPQLEFWSKFDIEDTWDKGELQISTDGGSVWNRVPMIYPGSSTHDNDECGLGPGDFFTGEQVSYSVFSADLSAWSGQEVTLRWLFSSDGSVVGDGWWIDDITITDVGVPGTCSSSGVIFADGFESGDVSAWAP